MDVRITTVILDFGGVLGLPQTPADVGIMASMCGLSPDAFGPAYRRRRLELDRGSLGADEYWRGIMEEGGVTATKELLARVNELDTLSWTAMNRRMIDWARLLRKAGLRTAILSNMPPDKVAFMRSRHDFRWLEEFPVVVFSSDVDMVKPEPGIYRLCLERLGAAPGECLFIDDHSVNIDAAIPLGMAAVLFTSCEELARRLSQRPGIPVEGLY
jgi:putative hydrolase of the HAD superfamily